MNIKSITCKIGKKEQLAGFSGTGLFKGQIPPLLKAGELGNVVMVHQEEAGDIHVTSIPRTFAFSDQDAWGYGGNGPECFSLNILFHFMRGNEGEARWLAGRFVKVVSSFPNGESCILLKEFVQSWIEFQKSEICNFNQVQQTGIGFDARGWSL